MTTRERLENIIIGTLLDNTGYENLYEDCRCCVTDDMFLNEDNRRIYGFIREMNQKGITETNPCNIIAEYGERVSDLVQRMVDLCVDYSFTHLKSKYNEGLWIASKVTGIKPLYSGLTFRDYLDRYITLVFEDYEEGKHIVAADATA